MYLKKVVGCLKPQVLLGNEASLSCIYDRLFQKLPLTYSMRKFIMIGNGHMCHTKGRFLWISDLQIGWVLMCISKSFMQRPPTTSFSKWISLNRIATILDSVVIRTALVKELKSSIYTWSFSLHWTLYRNCKCSSEKRVCITSMRIQRFCLKVFRL
jgi:hypothetical protein